MSRTKIIKVLNESLAPNEIRAFRHKISTDNASLEGILHSNNTALSLSFQNENELEIENWTIVLANPLGVPPSKKIITWNQNLNKASFICGTLRNLSNTKTTVSLYLYSLSYEK